MAEGSVGVAVEGGARLTLPATRALGSPVTVALRPEAVTVEPLRFGDAAPPNSADAVVEQVVYHGFVSHLYLRLSNDEPMVAFLYNQGAASASVLAASQCVRARTDEASNHVVRD